MKYRKKTISQENRDNNGQWLNNYYGIGFIDILTRLDEKTPTVATVFVVQSPTDSGR